MYMQAEESRQEESRIHVRVVEIALGAAVPEEVLNPERHAHDPERRRDEGRQDVDLDEARQLRRAPMCRDQARADTDRHRVGDFEKSERDLRVAGEPNGGDEQRSQPRHQQAEDDEDVARDHLPGHDRQDERQHEQDIDRRRPEQREVDGEDRHQEDEVDRPTHRPPSRPSGPAAWRRGFPEGGVAIRRNGL
jgi:hypothetical protein